MKQFILLALIATLFGCEEPKEVYDSEIQTYVISYKDEISGAKDFIYLQTTQSTEKVYVSDSTFDKYKVGDTIQVIIKYWEKPKKK